MFLPSQLPDGVRRKSETEIEQKMVGKKGKKAKANDQQDEMLNPSSSMASTSTHPGHPPGFVARSWARISGRRRRQRKQMAAMMGRRQERLATTLTTVERNGGGNGGGWPTIMMDEGDAGGNLARLAHLEENEEERRKRHFIGRGMDRLRRSIRRTLHKGSQSGQVLTNSSTDGQPSSSSGQSHRFSKNYCHSDEIAVRSAACSFPVKYLGTCEVFESRGMSVCESALQHLRTRKRTVKALLYVSGDGIRVVDQENNRGLIVDQTIEKVSFCSPDRHNDKGFAYICRDGATRRWMCHGFHASKDSGERLSHAVGCAFTVCLEKKKKRDAETAAYKSAQALANSLNKSAEILGGNFQNEHPQFAAEGIANEEFARTNQAYRSFRQLSISERRADPQKAILVEHFHRSQSSIDSPNNISATGGIVPAATPRPTANPALFERTGSLRAPILSSSTSLNSCQKSAVPSFNRFNSLQHGNNFELKSTRMSLHNEPIWEGEDWVEASANNGKTDGNQQSPFYNWPTNGSNRFYRTLPHSMPNFGKGGINNVIIPPPPILEEDKQQPMQSSSREMDNSHNSSPPADPFISNEERNIIGPSQFRADNWLEQTFQRAASSASSATLPRSATMNWPPQHPPPQQQQNWAQFPQSQSFQMAANWPNGSSNKSSNCPPAQPPPSLPFWINSGPSNSSKPLTSIAPMPVLVTTLRMPKENGQKGQDETDQSSIGAKNHSRKSSGNRRIGYQLLQETDVSLSPPKNESILERVITTNEENAATIDPFDVNWSQQVLKETAKQRQNGNGTNENGGGGKSQQQQQEEEGNMEKNNPFGWDLSSPPVNV